MAQEFRSEQLNGGHCLTEADSFFEESVRTFFRALGAQTIENYISVRMKYNCFLTIYGFIVIQYAK